MIDKVGVDQSLEPFVRVMHRVIYGVEDFSPHKSDRAMARLEEIVSNETWISSLIRREALIVP